MNKKILLSLGTAVVLFTSTLYASGSQCGNKQGKSQHKMMMKKGGDHNSKGGNIMKMMKMLDLSDKQRTQIKSILQDLMKNKVNPHDAFTENSFDKAKFIKLANEKKNGKIERKAELISKIYAVLNSSQKKDLKTMLNMKEIKKNKMMKKSCDGKSCKSNR